MKVVPVLRLLGEAEFTGRGKLTVGIDIVGESGEDLLTVIPPAWLALAETL